ncbi:MAG: hypothetical protein AB9880_00790 [Christensenellales bacterium]
MTGDTLFFAIVNRGKANRLLHMAQAVGAKGGTVFLGEGTLPSRLFDILGINETLKEVLMMAVPDGVSDRLYAMLREEFKLHKRFKGIAFSVPYHQWKPDQEPASWVLPRPDHPAYLCLFSVLDEGRGAECMAVARRAGAQGGTIVRARGAGTPQNFYFPLIIEPKKEIVMILAPGGTAGTVREAIYTGMGLDKPGGGIIFGLPVLETIGLYEERGRGGKP